MSLIILKKRTEFVRATKSGKRFATPALVVQAFARAEEAGGGIDRHAIRVGFTATKTLGGAVVRNRVKRRMREAARAVVPVLGRPGTDYVFIGRAATAQCEFAALLDQMKFALRSLERGVTSSARPKKK